MWVTIPTREGQSGPIAYKAILLTRAIVHGLFIPETGPVVKIFLTMVG